ncbi:uncharacterized protein LOC101892630 isoform X3 [Musca domestica]|uniref:Uncharacterized protein LOC101892630 isoform X3 n=2 Tax=Musca domestica TaxID=7370 RepID=A0ABM3V492_MUSDO|nr:uncharacterized protein LOC101892630 isoform X3 [Musca domestica]
MALQQQQETEKLVGEMLNFLESNSEDELDLEEQSKQASDLIEQKESTFPMEVNEKVEIKRSASAPKDVEEIPQNSKLPIWNTREIVTNLKKTQSLSLSPFQENAGVKQQSIWRPKFLNHVDKTTSPLSLTTDTNNNAIPKKFSTANCNDVYSQEIRKALYVDISDHPLAGSKEYYDAAQNYAIYGKDFLDFPLDLTTVMGKKSTAGRDMGTYSTTSAMGQSLAVGGGYSLSDSANHQMEAHNFGKSQINTSMSGYGISTTTSPAAATLNSTAATFYQLGSCITSQVRPVTSASASNSSPTALGAATYGMFMGNKVTYVPTATATSGASTMLYNQHPSHGSTNFISNSLANAALTASPAILYSNPMLTSAAQHYLNAFIKETHMMNNANNSGNPSQISSSTIYERLVYAQMLQQQIYHQSQQQQQAAMVGAMLHKQRVNAAAIAAAANAARHTATAGTNQGQSGIQSVSNSTASGTSSSLNTCSRQASAAANTTHLPTQTAVKASISEESSSMSKDQ